MEDKLVEIVNLELEIRQHISTLPDATSLKAMQDKNTHIKGMLKELHKLIQKLKQDAQEQSSEEHKQQILQKLQVHIKEEDNLTASLRKSNLLCKDNLEKVYQRERELLFEGGEEATKLRKLKTRQEVLKTHQQLTEILQRTTSSMAAETERSGQILSELVIDSTAEEHKGLNSSIRQGRSALNRLHRRDYTDTLLIVVGLILFLSVVLYIVKVRLGISFL